MLQNLIDYLNNLWSIPDQRLTVVLCLFGAGALSMLTLACICNWLFKKPQKSNNEVALLSLQMLAECMRDNTRKYTHDG